MTSLQKVYLVLFALVALACIWDLLTAGKYPSRSARQVRFKALGLLVWFSCYPLSVFVMDALSVGAWFALLAALGAVGALFFYWPLRKD
jgi:hypothetical protein